MKIAVYTSITATKDSLKAPRDPSGADFVLFHDDPIAIYEDPASVSCWKGRPSCRLFADPRRNSRAPKILAHQFLPGYDYSLWLDGSMRLLVPAADLVERCLGDADAALFRHTTRDCIYDEARVCSELRLDDPAVLEAQATAYREAGHPPKAGLYEGPVILRRHTAATERFNDAWWSEYCRRSCRDQLSFNYLARKLGLRIADLPGTIHDNGGIVAFEGHLKWQ